MIGRKRVLIAVIICAVMVVTPCAVTLSSWAHLGNMPTYDDVLVLQVGSDEATNTAFGIIERTFDSRNSEVREKATVGGCEVAGIHSTSCVARFRNRPLLRVGEVITSVADLETTMMGHHASVIIFVAHGTEAGIRDDTDCLGWSNVAEILSKASPLMSIFAACHGANAANLMDGGIGFDCAIDARVAGHVSSAIALAAFDGNSQHVETSMQTAFKYSMGIAFDRIKALPLGEIPSWWDPLKLVLIGFFTIVFYVLAPATAPQTLTQLFELLVGVLGLLYIIGIVASAIGHLIDQAMPVAGDWAPTLALLKNFTTVMASAIIGVILKYVAGISVPGLIQFIRDLVYCWTGRAAAESATAVDPNPISRGALAATAAILLITGIDIILRFGVLFWSNDDGGGDGDTSGTGGGDDGGGSGGGGGGGRDAML